ncbi:hypothetical protein Salat_0833700 [Sesamum alatum]|uniref:Uncharacterized protein n=1 Tax=Sesamum alatum TaxID=300844 RepID=A0AAE1YIA6_9LAMI|nr:hypothetical protein Salat_0833700 [Sesamum alatum]
MEATVSLARFEGLQDDILFIVPLQFSAQRARARHGDGQRGWRLVARGLVAMKKRSRGIHILELDLDMVQPSKRHFQGGPPFVYSDSRLPGLAPPRALKYSEQGGMRPWEGQLCGTTGQAEGVPGRTHGLGLHRFRQCTTTGQAIVQANLGAAG